MDPRYAYYGLMILGGAFGWIIKLLYTIMTTQHNNQLVIVETKTKLEVVMSNHLPHMYDSIQRIEDFIVLEKRAGRNAD